MEKRDSKYKNGPPSREQPNRQVNYIPMTNGQQQYPSYRQPARDQQQREPSRELQ